jgi:hypothetical protein
MGVTGLQKKRLSCIVVFQGSDGLGPWRIFARPGWRHCWIALRLYFPSVGTMARQYTLKIEPTTWGIDVDVGWQSVDDVAQAALAAGATSVLEFSVDTPPPWGYVPRGVLSCVSVIKAVLGLRAWWVVTPEQLHRLLVRRGANEVRRHGKPETAIHRVQGSQT